MILFAGDDIARFGLIFDGCNQRDKAFDVWDKRSHGDETRGRIIISYDSPYQISFTARVRNDFYLI